MKKCILIVSAVFVFWLANVSINAAGAAFGADLPEIKARGVLRHLGVPYANFVTGSGDGLDVDFVKLFARKLEVKYQYVKTDWRNAIGDLSGKQVRPRGHDIEISGVRPILGDIVASGLTILPWRQKVVTFSTPTFPTQVWLITRADSKLKPITPSGDIQKDIAAVKAILKGHSILGVTHTCLDPLLYGIEASGARVRPFEGKLNELAPAIIRGESETTLIDVPDVMIALEKWPGKIKVIGPVSGTQSMAYAFSRTSPQLCGAFNAFFKQSIDDRTYVRLVKKYYPMVFTYFPGFLKR